MTESNVIPSSPPNSDLTRTTADESETPSNERHLNPSRPTLTLQPPGLAPVVHVLKEETITIGRMKENAIVLDNHSVSLVHARLTRKDGEFFLKDLNSTNGTWVNGQPVKEARLQDRDEVRFADVSGRFEAPAAAGLPATVSPSPPGLRLVRDRSVEAPGDTPPVFDPGLQIFEPSVAIPPPIRSRLWECFLGVVVFLVVWVFGWRLAQGSRIGWQQLTDADLPAVVRRFGRDFQGGNSLAQIARQQPWELGGTIGAALLLAGMAWRLVRFPPPNPTELAPAVMARWVAAKTKASGETAAMWQRRALQAEQKAERVQTALRDGFVAQAAQLFKDESVKTLLSQREQLLQAQQCAAAEIAELERRLDDLQSPLQARLAAYEQRIEELEKALASKTEANKELIQARIQSLRQQLETQRTHNRITFN